MTPKHPKEKQRSFRFSKDIEASLTKLATRKGDLTSIVEKALYRYFGLSGNLPFLCFSTNNPELIKRMIVDFTAVAEHLGNISTESSTDEYTKVTLTGSIKDLKGFISILKIVSEECTNVSFSF